MESQISRVKDVDVIALSGRLDPIGAGQVKEILAPFLQKTPGKLVINLAAVVYISSAGLRELFVAAKACKSHAGELILCQLNADVQRIFEIAALPIRIVTAQEEALAAF